MHDCDYCGVGQAGFSHGTICDRNDQAIAEHYVHISYDSSELECAMLRHDEEYSGWEQVGCNINIEYVIEEQL